jgi:uncharacterized protein (TIRG00374 family)
MRSLVVPRASYFVASSGQPRVRRPQDAVKLLIGAALAGWALVMGEGGVSWEVALTDLVQSSPAWIKALLGLGYALSLVFAVVLVGVLIWGGRERRQALRDVAIVAVAASVVVVLVSFLVNSAWPYVFPEIDLQDPVAQFPVMRVAVVTAMLVAVGPHSTRPMRRFGWLAISATAIASVGLSYGSPTDTFGSLGIGLFCAGLLLVVAGSPRGYPDPEAVTLALSRLGVEARGLVLAPYQTWGVVRFIGRDVEGRTVDVKVHGRDAFDSQLAAKAWRTLWYRETTDTVGYSRLQAVQQEALVTLMAERAGVRVPELVVVGNADSELALVGFRDTGVALAELNPDLLTSQLLEETWRQVGLLHERSMSHGSLSTTSIQMGPDGPKLTDFALGSVFADQADQGSDIVELLFSSSLLVGEETAVRSAIAGLGKDRVIAALPYLQLPAVSSSIRRLADDSKATVSGLAAQVAAQTDAQLPKPVQLRRVTLRSVLLLGLILLIASALIPALVSVDYAEIWGVLESADWMLIILALVVGHLQFIPQATATMFAVPTTLPFWPLLTLQTASQFISLAIPSAAGRVAMNAAFLHKFGVPITVAIAQGAIDGFSGFLTQATLLILALLVGDVDLDFDPAQVRWLLVLAVLGLVVGGVVIAVMRIRALRDRIVPVVRQAWDALMTVLREPSRAVGLLGSNFIYWNVLGLTLWITLVAVGVELSYGSALFVAAGTSLLAGFMPVPGGVGVAEATMAALLATLGVDDSAALAVTAVYRVITFYLPALEGFFGTRWLERNEYI